MSDVFKQLAYLRRQLNFFGRKLKRIDYNHPMYWKYINERKRLRKEINEIARAEKRKEREQSTKDAD